MMIEIWMQNHLVSGSKLQHHKLYNPPKSLQGMTNNARLTFSVVDTILWYTISVEQDE